MYVYLSYYLDTPKKIPGEISPHKKNTSQNFLTPQKSLNHEFPTQKNALHFCITINPEYPLLGCQ